MTSTRTYEVTYESNELDYSETLEVEVEVSLEGDRDDAYVVVGDMWIEDEGKKHYLKLTTLENEIEEDGDLVESLIDDYESYRADMLYDAMMDAKMERGY